MNTTIFKANAIFKAMNKILRCFIVDDEPDARLILKKYIEHVPFLELVGESGDPISALFQVSNTRPDLLFLDIEMPGMTGFEFIRSLNGCMPQVILVTAYPDYALQGYDYQVVDYLLKPVPFDRFIKGVYKAANLPAAVSRKAEEELPRSGHKSYLLVKENKKIIRVSFDDIELLEATGDYVKIHLDQRIVITHSTLTKMDEQLPDALFMRINRSFIIRKNAISQIDGNEITTQNGKKVSIGATYRENVFGELYSQQADKRARG